MAGAYTIYQQTEVRCDAAEPAWKYDQRLISFEEVQKHVSEDDCWVVIDVRLVLRLKPEKII
jgi:cytochrome b involved in lipid metabolism